MAIENNRNYKFFAFCPLTDRQMCAIDDTSSTDMKIYASFDEEPKII